MKVQARKVEPRRASGAAGQENTWSTGPPHPLKIGVITHLWSSHRSYPGWPVKSNKAPSPWGGSPIAQLSRQGISGHSNGKFALISRTPASDSAAAVDEA